VSSRGWVPVDDRGMVKDTARISINEGQQGGEGLATFAHAPRRHRCICSHN
jgi:hypothetical protein